MGSCTYLVCILLMLPSLRYIIHPLVKIVSLLRMCYYYYYYYYYYLFCCCCCFVVVVVLDWRAPCPRLNIRMYNGLIVVYVIFA